MSRHTATVSAPVRIWGDIEAAVRGLAQVFTAPAPAADTGLEVIAREQNRIVQSSRHWLMG